MKKNQQNVTNVDIILIITFFLVQHVGWELNLQPLD